MKAYDPWADLARREGVELLWHAPGTAPFSNPNVVAVTSFSRLSISIKLGMNEAELRSTLTHELAHLDRGPVTADRTAREEDAVDLLGAQRLIDPADWEAVAGLDDDAGAAALGVDQRTCRVYSDWRANVTPRTARDRRRRVLAVTAWPAPWMNRYRLGLDAARGLGGVRT